MKEPSIRFQLFGVPYHVSIDWMGRALGFYTEEEQATEEYEQLKGDFSASRHVVEFWNSIAKPGVPWDSSNTLAKTIASEALRVVRMLLAYMGGRGDNLHKVYQFDLFCLRSMVQGTPVNMGAVIKRLLQNQGKERVRCIYAGAIVAQLCRGLRLPLDREVRVDAMVPLAKAELIREELTPIPVQDEEEGAEPPVMPPVMDVPDYYPAVYNWDSVRRFNYQLYHETLEANDQHWLDFNTSHAQTQGTIMSQQDTLLSQQGTIISQQQDILAAYRARAEAEEEAERRRRADMDEITRLFGLLYQPPAE